MEQNLDPSLILVKLDVKRSKDGGHHLSHPSHMPACIQRFSSRWRSRGDISSASDLERFWPLVSGGGSGKLRMIELAGVLKADGSL